MKRERQNCQKYNNGNEEIQQNAGKTNTNKDRNKNLCNNGKDKWPRSDSTAINKLQAYQLSEEQWNLAETLSAILEVIILVFHKQITDFNFVTDF